MVGGHAHLVRLHLRRPDDDEGAALHDLLAESAAAPQPVASNAVLATGAPGALYCYYDAQGRYICVPL
jgi:hypothetical protein